MDAIRADGGELRQLRHAVLIVTVDDQGLLLSGESTDIRLTAFVDASAAARMNLEAVRLEDTLILHTAFGKDHFISIAGKYGP